MDRRRAAGALLALAACIACSTAAPTASNQTALELLEGPSEGCYYNFQHYGEGDRIMTNEPCLNCTCHNKMLMCYLRVCPFTKPIGQDCSIEKRADQCCPIVTCPDVPVDLLTSTSTSSPAEYGATGLGKVDKYGCSINGKYFPEGSKVPPMPNKPCEHCYCIRNMTTCVMQECTLHVDGCTPIYHKDVCCPVRYSCDHLDDEMLLLDDMTTTVRPTPGFLLTTTTTSVTQASQDCVHDDQVFADGALIKTEKACEHCYCMKGDIVCVIQECGTPMENEGKNCTSLPPRHGQCCPDTYICEGDELLTEVTTGITYEELTTFSPPRRVEGSGYRNEPDEPYTEIPSFEGSGEGHATTLDASDIYTSQKQTPEIVDETFAATEESLKPNLSTMEPDREQHTEVDVSNESTTYLTEKDIIEKETLFTTQPTVLDSMNKTYNIETKPTTLDIYSPTEQDNLISKDDEFIMSTESVTHFTKGDISEITVMKTEIETETTGAPNTVVELTTQQTLPDSFGTEGSTSHEQEIKSTTLESAEMSTLDELLQAKVSTTEVPKYGTEYDLNNKNTHDIPPTNDKEDTETLVITSTIEAFETTSINPVENEIDENVLPPARIPGEGDCLLNGITYKNNSNVPNINNCHSSCKCMSSVVKCDPILCSPPPEHMDNMNDCQPIYDTPDACCPTYVCHSRETIPPESHSQMSGTESPKLSSEKPERECNSEECQPQENAPVSLEPCSSENCKAQQHEKCNNGACDPSESGIDMSPPLKYPEGCNGDTCQTSEEKCKNGQCQESSTSEAICNNETECQPTESCIGNNCLVEPQTNISATEDSICKDPELCKLGDTSKPICEGSSCDLLNEDKQVQNENNLSVECTEESCRRKEQTQEESKPQLECSTSSCNPEQQLIDESNAFTTESLVKDQTHMGPTSETTNDIYTKMPEFDETHTTPKQFETTKPVNQDSSELSTDKYESVTSYDLNEGVTEKEESYTEPSDTYTTKIEESPKGTDIKPEIEDQKPTALTSTSEEHVTESIVHVTTEISIEGSTLVTQYEVQSTELPKEDVKSTEKFTEPSSTSFFVTTESIKSYESEINKEEITDTSVDQEFTQIQETATEPSSLLVTTSKQLETDITSPEYTKKQEIYTESYVEETVSPVTETQKSTKIYDDIYTKIEPEVSVTDVSVTLSSTEEHVNDNINDPSRDTEIYSETTTVAGISVTTEQSVPAEESSEQLETKYEDTTLNNAYDDSKKVHTSSESPVSYTEMTPTETTVHDIYKTENESQSSETTEVANLPLDVNIGKKTTESPMVDQENLSQPPDTYDTITDKQYAYTVTAETDNQQKLSPPTETYDIVTDKHIVPDDTQEFVTSTSNIYNTPPSVTTTNIEMQTHETSIPDKDEPNLPEYTAAQDFEMKETNTEQTEISVTTLEELTTETVDKTEGHIYTSVKDFIEVTTGASDLIVQEETTYKEPSVTEAEENDVTTNIVQTEEQEMTLKPKPEIPTSEIKETTVPLILSENNLEITTKHTVTESNIDYREESTLIPEIHSTKLEESTLLPTETYKQTVQTSTDQQEKTEVTTKEEEKSNTTPAIDEGISKEDTVTPEMPYTDDETIPVSLEENKTDQIPLYTSPDMIEHYTEKQGTTLSQEHITTDNIVTDSEEDKHEPTDYLVSNTVEPQTNFTDAPEKTTQSAETKLHAELETDKPIYTTQLSNKDEEEQTESPMSLVTKVEESINSEEKTQESAVDKTTLNPHVTVSDEDKIEIPDDEKPSLQSTEYPRLTESEIKYDSESSSQIYPEKERQPESSSTSPILEYTTIKIPVITEIGDVDISTEVSEELSPTTEQDAVTLPQHSIKTDSESYPVDLLPESTPASSIASSTESFITEKQEISTNHPDVPVSVTKIVIEQDEDSQKQEHTMSPDLFTTKDVETIDNDEDKPSLQEEKTVAPEQHITTEATTVAEQGISPDVDIHSTVNQDVQKFTEVYSSSDEKDVTTSIYQDFTTVKEESMTDIPFSHLSTSGIYVTESPEISLSEEDHRLPLLPDPDHVQPDEHSTEKQIITKLPETTGIPDIEHTATIQELYTNSPERDITTKISTKEEFEYTTSLPQATINDIVLQTETISSHQNEELPAVTENIDQHTAKAEDAATTTSIEFGVSEGSYTDLYNMNEKDLITEKTTIHDGLIPFDSMPTETPSEQTKTQELPTEASMPNETEMVELNGTISLDTDTKTSLSTETEVSASVTTESSLLKDTDISVSKVTGDYVAEVTEASTNEAIGGDITKDFEAEVTEISVSEATEAAVPKVTNAVIPTEGFSPDITEVLESEISNDLPDMSEVTTPGATIDITSEVTDASIPKQTETEIIDREPNYTTYKPKDEKLGTSEEQSQTLELINSSSETTPYLVELQEHTTKFDEEISSGTLAGEEPTKGLETYQTERGDQSLDNLPHEEYTTMETFTNKDEHPVTVPVQQSTDYSEAKTEAAIKDISVSSESPISTVLDSEIGPHTIPSEEQNSTMLPTKVTEQDKITTSIAEVETTTYKKDLLLETEKIPEQVVMHETTASEDETIPTVTKATTIKAPEDTSTYLPVVDDKFTKPQDKPAETYSPTVAAEPEPDVNEIQPTEEIPSPDFPPSGPGGYGQEPDDDKEDQAFGPGTCRYGGKVYVSAQQIPRDDPCDFCFCFRSDIICLQQSCPPPIHGCHEEPIQGFCCPRYECPVSMATTLNVTTTTTTTTTTLPPHFLPHAYKGAAQRRGCQIKGHSYKVGEVVRASSGPCLHCTCGGDGQMKCDPKACTPEPMLRQMIAAAVSAKRRR